MSLGSFFRTLFPYWLGTDTSLITKRTNLTHEKMKKIALNSKKVRAEYDRLGEIKKRKTNGTKPKTKTKR